MAYTYHERKDKIISIQGGCQRQKDNAKDNPTQPRGK